MKKISAINEQDITVDSPMIYKAISEVMKAITPIAKTQKNPQQGYMFRGIDQIYSALQPIFASHGIFCVPTVLEQHTEDRPSKSGGTLFRTILKMQYRFYATDGSYVDAVTVGEAMDSSDKSCNKAMSASQKYAFLQIFNIPTDEVKDTENETHETEYVNTITTAQIQRLFAIARSAGRSDEDVRTVLTRFNYEHTRDISRKDYDLIIAALEVRK